MLSSIEDSNSRILRENSYTNDDFTDYIRVVIDNYKDDMKLLWRVLIFLET